MRLFLSTLLVHTIGVANAKSCGIKDVMKSAVDNPAAWMKTLADACGDDFKTKRFTEILLPGSHDAGAWRKGTGFNWYCDALAMVGYDVCNNWFVTQEGDMREQLSAGARFLDFRAHWNSADDIRHDNFGGSSGCVGLDCWKIWHPPPHGGEFGPIRVPAGLDMTTVSAALTLIKNFTEENPTEVVVVDMKLQQVSDKEVMSVFGYNNKITTQRLRLLRDFLKKELGDVIFNGANYNGKWWHETVGTVMDSGKPIILQITGDTDELEGGDLDDKWLQDFIVETCSGNSSCKGEPIWSTTYADSCCNDSYIIENQADKRKIFVTNFADEPADERPLMKVGYQVTYPNFNWQDGVEGANLREATAVLRNRTFDFYNQIVEEDGKMDSFPIANIVGMDFITDCPAAVVALAVCGSVLQHDENCKREYLPADITCLSDTGKFEVPLREVAPMRQLWAVVGVLFVIYLCLLCSCCCAWMCGGGKCANGYYWIHYLSIIGIVYAYDEYEAVPRARELTHEDGSYSLLSASE